LNNFRCRQKRYGEQRLAFKLLQFSDVLQYYYPVPPLKQSALEVAVNLQQLEQIHYSANEVILRGFFTPDI
jgi:hypothetical protein